jgi:hypothetical protein
VSDIFVTCKNAVASASYNSEFPDIEKPPKGFTENSKDPSKLTSGPIEKLKASFVNRASLIE